MEPDQHAREHLTKEQKLQSILKSTDAKNFLKAVGAPEDDAERFLPVLDKLFREAAQVFSEKFTDEEVDEWFKFQQSPTGRAFLEKGPQLMAEVTKRLEHEMRELWFRPGTAESARYHPFGGPFGSEERSGSQSGLLREGFSMPITMDAEKEKLASLQEQAADAQRRARQLIFEALEYEKQAREIRARKAAETEIEKESKLLLDAQIESVKAAVSAAVEAAEREGKSRKYDSAREEKRAEFILEERFRRPSDLLEEDVVLREDVSISESDSAVRQGRGVRLQREQKLASVREKAAAAEHQARRHIFEALQYEKEAETIAARTQTERQIEKQTTAVLNAQIESVKAAVRAAIEAGGKSGLVTTSSLPSTSTLQKAVSNLTVTRATPKSVTLNWGASGPDAKYSIKRSEAGTNEWSSIADHISQTTYTDSNVQSRNYQYVVSVD